MADSLAVFRKGLGPDMAALAEKHMQHDLTASDRDALQSAARTVTIHTSIGSLIGLSLGAFLAFRLRRSRRTMFRTFKTSEKPTAVRFADGREEALPDLTALVRPSRLGDIATYTLLGAGGILFGGEAGLLTGSFGARRAIASDRDSRERISTAFRGFRADALRAQADLLERQGEGDWGL